MDGLTPLEIKEKDDKFKEYYDEIKDKLNKKIVDNPKFEELFFKELNFFFRKTLSIDYVIEVSEDSNSLTITSFNPVYDCKEEFRGKNRSFLRTIFKLKDDNLVCDFNQGTLFDRKELEKSGMKAKLKYETKIETNYSTRFFDKDGIEYSDNSYSDVYHFDDDIEDIDLRERTMSSFHKPTFNEYQFPKMAIHVMHANVRNTYRKNDSLGIIHSNVAVATPDGYSNIVCALFTAHPSYPEMIRGGLMFARTPETNDGNYKFELTNNYASNMDEAYKKATLEFKNGVLESNLKEYNEKIYNALVNRI